MSRVLVIEDDPAILRGLVDNLRHESFDVVSTSDGADGYRMIRETNPDLILLDLTLPSLDGTEICRRARSSGITTPIVMLTARGDETDRVLGLEDGADDYVTKPFSIRELVARVRAILRQRREWLQERAHLDRDLRKAAEVQRRLLPQASPPVATLDYAGSCQPASLVGGDYFDFIDIAPGRVGLLVADVCGKGIPAALLTASIHAAMRSSAPLADTRCADLLQEVNTLLYQSTDPSRFATMVYAVYDDATATLTVANAGHPPPLHVAAAGHVLELDGGGPPLGMFEALAISLRTVALAPGDWLVMFSDGVLEAADVDDGEFGIDRLVELVTRTCATTADALRAEIVAAVEQHTRGRPPADDVTVVVARGRARGGVR